MAAMASLLPLQLSDCVCSARLVQTGRMRANMSGRHAVQWRRRGFQREQIANHRCNTNSNLTRAWSGWRIHRVDITLRLGRHGNRSLHRTFGSRGSMVSTTRKTQQGYASKEHRLRSKQGHLHHRNIDSRRRRESTPDTDEELDFNHLLRSRGHLRSHHVHRVLGQAHTRER